MPRSRRRPAYTLHRPTGQARVRVDGRDHYLGPHGSQGSRDRYDDLVAEWLARNDDATRYSLAVDDLVLLYFEHAARHYRKNGRSTSELSCIKTAIRYLVAECGRVRVREFGPRKLLAVREAMIRDGHCRRSINKHTGRIRRLFRWAVKNEYCPPEIVTSLECVDPLEAGRCEAVETEPIRPVPQDQIDAIKPYVSRPVWAMVQLQVLTGMRPSEVMAMRACDLNMSGRVWEYVPQSHKTEHHGRGRLVFIGPQAQRIIREFLKPDLAAYLFSPRDVRDVKPGGERQPGERYNRDAYRNAIQRAFSRARMPNEYRPERKLSKAERERRKQLRREWLRANAWHPHQLRHNAATELRRQFGIEAARTVLGHAALQTTEFYAEIDLQHARKIMAKVG